LSYTSGGGEGEGILLSFSQPQISKNEKEWQKDNNKKQKNIPKEIFRGSFCEIKT
jgi:hypothetical protein